MDEQDVYNCNDADLGTMLHRLLVKEGHDEVEIMHPVDGPIVVTREQFLGYCKEIDRARNMSPADKVRERAKLKNIQKQKQIHWRTDMLTANVHTIDPHGEDNFGFDIEGNELDINGMIFVPVKDYLPGIELVPNELGCFVDEREKRKPIRIAAE